MKIKPYHESYTGGLAALRQWLAECGYTVSAIKDGTFIIDTDADARQFVRYAASCYRCVVVK
jgi:hypothetical protein